MADKSRIEWTDATWNPITGCTPVSEGCEHCYAKRMANRFKGRFGYPDDDPFRVTFHEDRLYEPMSWKKPRRVFVCSMGDLFHEDVQLDWIEQIFERMREYDLHEYMLLTKRPSRVLEYWKWRKEIWLGGHMTSRWPNNVWLGVTAENQRTADERIPILLQTPAAVRFVSVEPMLGPVAIQTYLPATLPRLDRAISGTRGADLDWVICGGESGPGARPMHPNWARSLRDQCATARVPFFFKQWGGGNKSRKLEGFVHEAFPDA